MLEINVLMLSMDLFNFDFAFEIKFTFVNEDKFLFTQTPVIDKQS